MGPYDHPSWCGKGHRCNLGEHRSNPQVMEIGGVGKVFVTRILGRNGRERMELTGSAYLSGTGPAASRQMDRTLRGFAQVMAGAAA